MNRDDKGFTLVEMLAVLAIIAVVIAVGLPYSRQSSSHRKLESDVFEVVSMLERTKIYALKSNEEETITFDVEKKIVTTSWSKKNLDLNRDISMKVLTAQDEIVDKSASIRFYPHGGATGGKIVLADERSQRVISINWLTGAIVLNDGMAHE